MLWLRNSIDVDFFSCMWLHIKHIISTEYYRYGKYLMYVALYIPNVIAVEYSRYGFLLYMGCQSLNNTKFQAAAF